MKRMLTVGTMLCSLALTGCGDGSRTEDPSQVTQAELDLITEKLGPSIDRSTDQSMTKALDQYQVATADWPKDQRKQFMAAMRASLEGAGSEVRAQMIETMAGDLTLDEVRRDPNSQTIKAAVEWQALSWERDRIETQLISRAVRKACAGDEALAQRCAAMRSGSERARGLVL
jgi:hypothetical protein